MGKDKKGSRVKFDDMARMDWITRIVAGIFFGGLTGLAVAFFVYAYLCQPNGIPGAVALSAVPVCMLLAILLGDGFWRLMKAFFWW